MLNKANHQLAIVILSLWLTISLSLCSLGQTKPEPKNWLKFGLTLSPQVNFSKFSEPSIMYSGLRISPLPVYSLGISYIQELNRRLALEGGINLTRGGVKTAISTSYPGNNKYERDGVSKTTYGLIALPLLIRVQTYKNEKRVRKFIKLGTHLLVRPSTGGYTTASSSTRDFHAGINIKEEVSWESTFLLKPTMFLGIGMEKQFGYGGSIALSIFYNKGFSAFPKMDYRLTVGSRTYENKILNKGTSFGFGLQYFFKPVGYKVYKKRLEEYEKR